MAIRRRLQLSSVLLCIVGVSQVLASVEDQYKAREDELYPRQLFSEATDHTQQVIKFESENKMKTALENKTKLYNKKKKYGEKSGLITHLFDQTENRGRVIGKTRRRRAIDDHVREKRNYYSSWRTHIVQVPVDDFSAWQPTRYQISRPYFVPLWGSSGQIPVYFPPQPLLINPGYPIDNPPNRKYLPPDPNNPVETTTAYVGIKYGDDNPVWDVVTQRPGQVGTTTYSSRPTRRTLRPGETSTFPPLIHNSGNSNSGNSGPKGNHLAFTTVKPPLNIEVPPEAPPAPAPPSRCVWAIIACCSANSVYVSYNCFEQQGCSGAFWDTSPCNSDYARAAIATAMKYYNA